MSNIEVRTLSHSFGWSYEGRSSPFAMVESFPVTVEYELLANAPKIANSVARPGPRAREHLLRMQAPPRAVRFSFPQRRGAVGEVVQTEDVLTLSAVKVELEVATLRSFVVGDCGNQRTDGGRLKQPRFMFVARPVVSYQWTLMSHAVKYNNRGQPVPVPPTVIVKDRAEEDGPLRRRGPGSPVLPLEQFECESVEIGTELHRWFDYGVRRVPLDLA